MSDDIFRQNKPGPDCPSALLISRYILGELAEDRARAVEEHLAACTHCNELAEAERGGVEAARTEPVPSRLTGTGTPRRTWLPWSLAATVAAAAAAVVLAVWILPGTTPTPGDGTRVKGTLALSATLDREGRVLFEGRDLGSIDVIREGDRLRLRVKGVVEGRLALQGCDAGGCRVLYRGTVPAGGRMPVGVQATAGESRLDVIVCPDDALLASALASPGRPPAACRIRSYPILVTRPQKP
jgi:hypothetical protein